jgi:very-short-patch-repair endonuclease
MRAVLSERGRGYVPTESELDLLGRAVVAPVGGFEWQVQMSDERGYIRRVDGLHRRGRLVIELDGAEFHDTAHQRRLDAEGDARLRALGLDVVRFRWADVTLRPAVVRRAVADLTASTAAA